jgi:DNA-binding GntR family transcriptional regulator
VEFVFILHVACKILQSIHTTLHELVQMERTDSFPSPVSLSSLDTSSLSSKVYDRLLTAVVRKELAAGQPLDVEKLAEAFGVSRTPVQTAISRLADLGLVEIRPRRGTFVASLTTQDVHELFEIRGLIEVHAVRRGIQLASDAELMTLRAAVEGLRGFFSGDDYTDYYVFLERDRRFHSAIVGLAKNRRLVKMYDQARTLLELTRASASKTIGGASLTHERHVAIVEALIARHVGRAVAALEKHTRESEEAITARLHFPAE